MTASIYRTGPLQQPPQSAAQDLFPNRHTPPTHRPSASASRRQKLSGMSVSDSSGDHIKRAIAWQKKPKRMSTSPTRSQKCVRVTRRFEASNRRWCSAGLMVFNHSSPGPGVKASTNRTVMSASIWRVEVLKNNTTMPAISITNPAAAMTTSGLTDRNHNKNHLQLTGSTSHNPSRILQLRESRKDLLWR